MDRAIYLFQCGWTDRYALSSDKTGCNIPRRDPDDIWLLRAPLANYEANDLREPLKQVERIGFCLLFIRPDED